MRLKYYSLLLGVLIMASCDKGIEMPAPTFDVTTEATTFKAGAPVNFKISGGDAQMISFYSGETLSDFYSKDGRVIDVNGAGATVSFSSSVQLGAQTNQLTVLASTNFNGDYSSLAKVKAATWVDITNRFVLGTNATLKASGSIDISDLLVAGKPIYFAYKYITKPQATNGIARQWFIQSFTVNSKKKLDDEITVTIADQAGAGFRIVDENKEKAPALSSITATRLTLQGNVYLHAALPQFDPTNPMFDPLNPQFDRYSSSYSPTLKLQTYVPFDPASPYNDPLSEHWAVSKGITVDKVDLGPDRSKAIKGISNPVITEHKYTYSNAGTYKAVFIATNASIDDEKKVIKEITLTVAP